MELFHGQAAMSVIERFGERIRNAGPDPDHGGFLDAKLHGYRIGGLESDTADILGQPERVFRHDLHGIVAVGLIDAHRAGRADAVRMQEDHDLTDDLLFGPSSDDALGPARPDSVHLAQASGCSLDDIEDFVAKGLKQALGVDGADAADHAGGEVFLHALDRGWLRRFEKLRPELQSVGAVVLPAPACRHPFAGRDRRSVTDGGDEVLMAAGFHAEHAKSVLLVVKGHPFHQAGKNLALFVDLGHNFAEKTSSGGPSGWFRHHKPVSEICEFRPRGKQAGCGPSLRRGTRPMPMPIMVTKAYRTIIPTSRYPTRNRKSIP